MLGVGMHAIGALFAANCYSPQKYVKRWSWEIFWLIQAAWCWFLLPIIGAYLTIPQLWQVLSEGPKDRMLYSFLMGIAYGVGGTAFNVSIRYIGFSLTYAIAVGLSSILGTLIPPLVRGQFCELFSRVGAVWIFGGVVLGAIGIGICGIAGRYKENDIKSQSNGPTEFSLTKGMLLSLLAGVLSAVYGFALEVAGPVADVAEKYGAGVWKGNVGYIFANSGAFITAALYSLYLARKNRSLPELVKLRDGQEHASLVSNYLLAFLTGALWYGQFFFYNLGHVRLGPHYAFSSWAIHMIMLVLFSNLVAILFKEWKGCMNRTKTAIGAGLIVLCLAVLFLTYGNYLGEPALK